MAEIGSRRRPIGLDPCNHGQNALAASETDRPERLATNVAGSLLGRSPESAPPSAVVARKKLEDVVKAFRRLEGTLLPQAGTQTTRPGIGRMTWSRHALAPSPRLADDPSSPLSRPSTAEHRHAAAHKKMADVLQKLDQREKAVVHYRVALVLRPDDAEARKNFGIALQALGRHEEALEQYRLVLVSSPSFVEMHNDIGNVLQILGRHEDAIAHYERLLGIRPDYARAHYNMGNALRALHRYEAALACYRQAISHEPDYVKAHNNLGITLNALGRSDEAIAHYEKIIALEPSFAGAYVNYGNALQALNRPNDALVHYRRAIAINPRYVDAYSNMGHALYALNRHEEALGWFARATAVDPQHPDAHWNEALTRLALGEFETGWRKYEWRWRNPTLGLVQRTMQVPTWLGQEDIAGKTILIHAEQGFGDALQFARYVPLVARRGARIIFEVHPPLVSLLAGLAGVAVICAHGDALPPFDRHCPLMSLPLALGTAGTWEIPSHTPYIASPTGRFDKWCKRLPQDGRPRIGIVWRGNPAHKNDRNRSLSLDIVCPLLCDAGQHFIALQKDIDRKEAAVLASFENVTILGATLKDFADTAAVVAQLDLVITADTAVAHLAGTMGKPVWILLPFAADWRWLVGREDSPWYPSARLFRQPTIGDWHSVVARVRRAIRCEMDEVRTTRLGRAS